VPLTNCKIWKIVIRRLIIDNCCVKENHLLTFYLYLDLTYFRFNEHLLVFWSGPLIWAPKKIWIRNTDFNIINWLAQFNWNERFWKPDFLPSAASSQIRITVQVCKWKRYDKLLSYQRNPPLLTIRILNL
jgi:hypothetical protein